MKGSELAGVIGQRIWERDASLWKPDSPDHQKIIANRLGWLDVIDTMKTDTPRLLRLAESVRRRALTDCVLLGMGGSSLCPEVLRQTFGAQPGSPRLHVLDTTDPQAITELTGQLNATETLFIVASKSGGTIETLSHFAHFWEWIRSSGLPEAGRHFIAITDAGTPLEKLAREHAFEEIFLNPSDIGGRYSALSYFGMVPAAIAGIDFELLLHRADEMRRQCAAANAPGDNPGLRLGLQMAEMQAAGRDKLTIVASGELASFGLWAEQLLAESTGKEGTGIIPVSQEPPGEPGVYGADRFFVVMKPQTCDAGFEAGLEKLSASGQPLLTLELQDSYDLGAEFFRWEFATAVAGSLLGIDPFDEPNVQESKDNTKRMLTGYQANGSLPPAKTAVSDNGIDVIGGDATTSVGAALEAHIAGAREGDYIALMAYLDPSAENFAQLQRLRLLIRDRTRRATTLGFGPRFLHSTGQLHKGGPNTGVFIQLTADDRGDVSIPGSPWGFSVLKQAQADGDLQALQDHKRRVIRLHLHGDATTGLSRVHDAMLQPTTGVG